MSIDRSDIVPQLQVMLMKFIDSSITLSANSDFTSDLALESIQLMEFMVDIEDHYDIAVDLDSLSRVKTLSELADVVAKLVSTQ